MLPKLPGTLGIPRISGTAIWTRNPLFHLLLLAYFVSFTFPFQYKAQGKFLGYEMICWNWPDFLLFALITLLFFLTLRWKKAWHSFVSGMFFLGYIYVGTIIFQLSFGQNQLSHYFSVLGQFFASLGAAYYVNFVLGLILVIWLIAGGERKR